MRYIAIFLVIANLAYLGWQLYFPAPELPAIAAAPRPLLNQGLVLLREFEQQTQALRQEQAVNDNLCYLVGDFRSLDDATDFTSTLISLGYSAELHMAGDPLPSQYRVYLPPASSRDLATSTLQDISERFSEESVEIETYLITRGTLQNAIALGVFGDLTNAERVRDEAVSLGYAAEIAEIRRSAGPVQVVLATPDFEPLEIAEWLDFAGDRPDLTYSENVCETIAQGGQFP